MFGSSVLSIIFTMLIENYLTSVNLKKENGKNYPTTRKAQNGKTFYQMANSKAKTHKKMESNCRIPLTSITVA